MTVPVAHAAPRPLPTLPPDEQAVVDDLSPEWHQARSMLLRAASARGFEAAQLRWWRHDNRRVLANACVRALQAPQQYPPVVLDWLMAVADPTWTTRLGASPAMAALGYASEAVALHTLRAVRDPRWKSRPQIPGDGALVKGATPPRIYPLTAAAERGFLQATAALLDPGPLDRPCVLEAMGRAMQAQQPAVAELLLPHVSTIRSSWWVAAIQNNHRALFERMLERFDAFEPDDSDLDWSPLHVAARHDRASWLPALLKHVAPDRRTVSGETALHTAAYFGSTACVQALLTVISPHAVNQDGADPVMYALNSDHVIGRSVVDLLLPVSDLTRTSQKGTAFDIACRYASGVSPFDTAAYARRWERADQVATYDPNQEKVAHAFAGVRPENVPIWTCWREQGQLRAVLEDGQDAPVVARRSRL